MAHLRLVRLQTKAYGAKITTMRESWTDERLDDLNNKVDRGFDRLDADFRAMRAEMQARFAQMDARFDAMQRMLIQIGGGMIVTFVVGFASLLIAHA
ncbi:MAG TPA: hypothetical protein VFP23_04350 [Solirubrobacterales bacterium]|nr:hypothetical protein [Solirubrobacterales bacterium]